MSRTELMGERARRQGHISHKSGARGFSDQIIQVLLCLCTFSENLIESL